LAIAVVQTGAILRNSSSSTIAPTLGGVTAGNTVVAIVGARLSATLVTFTASANWQKAVGNDQTGQSVDIWYLIGNDNAGGTINPTFTASSGSPKVSAFLFELSGCDPASPYETSNTNLASSPATTCASGALSGNSSTSIAIAAFMWEIATGTLTYTAGTNYTNLANNGSTSATDHIAGDYRLLAPTGDQESGNSSSAASTSPGWNAAIATFKAAANHNVVTASDTLATITDTATRISHVSLKATDTVATVTDSVTRAVRQPRVAGDTLATITDTATRGPQAFARTAADSLFALSDVAVGPPGTVFTYAPAPPGWQPWDVPSGYQVIRWDSEVYQGGGLGLPPPVNTAIVCAQVDMGAFTLKVWILASEVTPSG